MLTEKQVELAARMYCQSREISPDLQVIPPEDILNRDDYQGYMPYWEVIAQDIKNLDLMLESIKMAYNIKPVS
jgi:hypothetical protein